MRSIYAPPCQVMPGHLRVHTLLLHRYYPCGSVHRSQRYNCHTGNGNVAWLDQASSPVRQDYDAIITLAGGLTPDGGLPEWVNRRLDAAADIQLQQGGHCPLLCLGGGTPHKRAVLGSSGHVVHEATSCARYLRDKKGVAPSNILKEVSSYDTVGNGFFALTIHAIPAAWRRCSVVTSAFHMPRSRAIFEKCFALAGATLWDNPDHFQLDFHAVHDESLFSDDVLEARCLKEQLSLEAWQRDTAAFCTLADLHKWMHATHLCYAVARQEDFGRPQPMDAVHSKALASY